MRYGEIKNLLKEKGKPIPENDIWIAAIAKEHNLVLITKDKHFRLVDDIKIWYCQVFCVNFLFFKKWQIYRLKKTSYK